jgi:hypothetical protein
MIKYFYTEEMTKDVLTALKINLSPQWNLHLAVEMGLV